MATNTSTNVGIRRNFVTVGDANFENSGTVQYYCAREPLMFLGTAYHVDDALTFDVGGTSYSKAALQQLELFWNNGWIRPALT